MRVGLTAHSTNTRICRRGMVQHQESRSSGRTGHGVPSIFLGVCLLAAVLHSLQGAAGQSEYDLEGRAGRRLASYFDHNFGASIDTVCYRSAYLSPYRMYSVQLAPASNNSLKSVLEFELRTVSCQVPTSPCCQDSLDKLVILAGDLANKVSQVTVGGGVKPVSDIAVDAYGLNINNMDLGPTAGQVMSLTITVDAPVSSFKDFCPDGRYDGSCDFIAFNPSRTCCLSRSAVPISLFMTSPPLEPATTAPSPPPLSASEQCCVDDVQKSPYRIKFMGKQRTGSDTAFDFQLWNTGVDSNYTDLDAAEQGTCSRMSIRDLKLSVFNNLQIKQVLVNDTDYYFTPSPNTADSNWITMSWVKNYGELDPLYPVDVTVIVRGKVDQLCPASRFMKSPNVCEYVVHGADSSQQCCPHSLTRHTSPDSNCIDDLPRSPYRLQYLQHVPSADSTTFTFSVGITDAALTDADGVEVGNCDRMSLDSAQISLYKDLVVTSVAWNGRELPINITSHTDRANWLNINGLHTYYADLEQMSSAVLTIAVEGYVNEPCPASWLMASPAYTCEYVLHGTQSAYSCCPHGLSQRGQLRLAGGCRDDLSETPYRLAYAVGVADEHTTTFTFNLARVETGRTPDYDGADFNLNHEVNCTGMGIQDIKLDIYNWYKVTQVVVNGAELDWQTTQNTPYSDWLWILGVDLSPSDLSLYQPINVQVTVQGSSDSVTELCPASAFYGSASSCEYVVTGSITGYDQCCPKGVTSYYTPERLKYAAGLRRSFSR